MNRAFYFVGGVAVMLSIFVAQSVDGIQQFDGSGSSQSVEPTPAGAAASDASSAAIDDLAAWPAAAGR